MPNAENENDMLEIKQFFDNTPGLPLKEGEFKDFWMSLSKEERDEFRKQKLEN